MHARVCVTEVPQHLTHPPTHQHHHHARVFVQRAGSRRGETVVKPGLTEEKRPQGAGGAKRIAGEDGDQGHTEQEETPHSRQELLAGGVLTFNRR